jgi:hypothetical protein
MLDLAGLMSTAYKGLRAYIAESSGSTLDECAP